MRPRSSPNGAARSRPFRRSRLVGTPAAPFFALLLFLCPGARAGTAAAWMLGPFSRPAAAQPVLTARPDSTFPDPIGRAPVHWEALHTFNPAAVVRGGTVDLLYRAEDDSGSMEIGMHTSRLGLAESEDGVRFRREPGPVFYPAPDGEQAREWPGGTEDPRLVESPEGGYVLTYTQWNRQTYRVGIATSPDLHHWTKHGPAFGLGRWAGMRYKSAGILTECASRGRCVAVRLHGRYWMYWGEVEVGLATSTDLVHWEPVTGKGGSPLILMRSRRGRFDSALPEVGPPPVLTAQESSCSTTARMHPARIGIPPWPPAFTRWGRRCFRPAAPGSFWRGPIIRSSSRSFPGSGAASMQPGPPLPRGWPGFTTAGGSTTAARTRAWAWRRARGARHTRIERCSLWRAGPRW